MIFKITIKKRGAVPSHLTGRQRQEMNRKAYRAGARWYHRMYVARHFTRAALRLYDYTPRQGDPERPHDWGFQDSYQGRKLKTQGHTDPLVYTGRSRDRATTIRDIRATAYQAKLRLHAPALNFRVHTVDCWDVNMRRDVLATREDEMVAVGRVIGRAWTAEARNLRRETVVNVTG